MLFPLRVHYPLSSVSWHAHTDEQKHYFRVDYVTLLAFTSIMKISFRRICFFYLFLFQPCGRASVSVVEIVTVLTFWL